MGATLVCVPPMDMQNAPIERTVSTARRVLLVRSASKLMASLQKWVKIFTELMDQRKSIVIVMRQGKVNYTVECRILLSFNIFSPLDCEYEDNSEDEDYGEEW